jgi:hypothetical protein
MKALRTVLLDTLYGVLNQDCGRIYNLGMNADGLEVLAEVAHIRRNEGVVDLEILIRVVDEEGDKSHTVYLGVKVQPASATFRPSTPEAGE